MILIEFDRMEEKVVMSEIEWTSTEERNQYERKLSEKYFDDGRAIMDAAFGNGRIYRFPIWSADPCRVESEDEKEALKLIGKAVEIVDVKQKEDAELLKSIAWYCSCRGEQEVPRYLDLSPWFRQEFKCYKKIVEQGTRCEKATTMKGYISEAQYEICRCYCWGKGVRKDTEEAERWYIRYRNTYPEEYELDRGLGIRGESFEQLKNSRY